MVSSISTASKISKLKKPVKTFAKRHFSNLNKFSNKLLASSLALSLTSCSYDIASYTTSASNSINYSLSFSDYALYFATMPAPIIYDSFKGFATLSYTDASVALISIASYFVARYKYNLKINKFILTKVNPGITSAIKKNAYKKIDIKPGIKFDKYIIRPSKSILIKIANLFRHIFRKPLKNPDSDEQYKKSENLTRFVFRPALSLVQKLHNLGLRLLKFGINNRLTEILWRHAVGAIASSIIFFSANASVNWIYPHVIKPLISNVEHVFESQTTEQIKTIFKN